MLIRREEFPGDSIHEVRFSTRSHSESPHCFGALNFSVEIRYLASQVGMVCTEYRRLEQRYNSALRRWAQYVRPQAIVPPGRDQLERARVLRQEALIERDSASHTLYLHRSTCLFCKSHEAKPD